MGRYVSGDFDYKFAFGEQNSSFGEVLENIVDDANDNNTEQVAVIVRYIADVGEKVELIIDDKEVLIKEIENYVDGFEDMTNNEKQLWSKMEIRKKQDFWDKYMMVKFLKELKEIDSFVMNFEVEY